MEENKLINVNYVDIKSLIFTIRGKQVILDSDIAKQYEVETKRVNEAVKRNLKRFPQEFCFQLTESEVDNIISQDIIFDSQEGMRSQFATASVSLWSVVERFRKEVFWN